MRVLDDCVPGVHARSAGRKAAQHARQRGDHGFATEVTDGLARADDFADAARGRKASGRRRVNDALTTGRAKTRWPVLVQERPT